MLIKLQIQMSYHPQYLHLKVDFFNTTPDSIYFCYYYYFFSKKQISNILKAYVEVFSHPYAATLSLTERNGHIFQIRKIITVYYVSLFFRCTLSNIYRWKMDIKQVFHRYISGGIK